jgi:predicted RNA binding protein YcfA (HicA-like mRNA interferase family)
METSLDIIDSLSDKYPDIFEDRGNPFSEDNIIIGVNDPDGTTTEDIFNDSLDHTDENLRRNIDWGGIISDLPDGNHPGSPIYGGKSRIPPIDALAFYLPFHYYPKWWGIYLTVEGLLYLAGEINYRSPNFVPARVAQNFAKVFLYRHEFFHHKIESFATRMECITRTSCYATGIEDRYQKTKFTADWFEESLANACALSHTFSVFKKVRHYRKYMDDCMNALIGIVKDSDEGYRQGADYALGNYIHVWGGHGSYTYEKAIPEICEEYLLACFPHITPSGLDIWSVANRTHYPIANVKSRTNFIISSHSRFRHRIAEDHFFAKPNKIIKAIENYGIELHKVSKSGKGSHLKYKVMNGPRSGHAFELPRKPQRGTIKDIWKQATGESLSLTRLKAII